VKDLLKTEMKLNKAQTDAKPTYDHGFEDVIVLKCPCYLKPIYIFNDFLMKITKRKIRKRCLDSFLFKHVFKERETKRCTILWNHERNKHKKTPQITKANLNKLEALYFL
jgi:hypothetical protein